MEHLVGKLSSTLLINRQKIVIIVMKT